MAVTFKPKKTGTKTFVFGGFLFVYRSFALFTVRLLGCLFIICCLFVGFVYLPFVYF